MRKGEIGRRIRAVRQERKLSLRQVAQSADLSATHISEIERGHTTPTVGALVRIASALECEPHFFLEEEWLPEVSIVRAAEAPAAYRLSAADRTVHPLSTGIPGGHLYCFRLTLEPGATGEQLPLVSGEFAGYVLRGRLELRAADSVRALGPGDGIHLRAEIAHQLVTVGNEPAEIVCVVTQPGDYGPPEKNPPAS